MTSHAQPAPALRRLVLLVLIPLALALAQAPLASPAQAAGYDAEELEFLEMLNDYRAENGAGPVKLSDEISFAADRHSSDMGNYGFFEHYTQGSDYYPVGSAPWDRMETEGFDCSGGCSENIAAGYATAEEAFEAWQTSTEGHNENMLDPAHRVTGIARVYVEGSPYGWYWTSGFGDVDDGSGEEIPATPSGGSGDAGGTDGGSGSSGGSVAEDPDGSADGGSINIDENASETGESNTEVCVVENGEQRGDCEEMTPEEMQQLQNELQNASGGGAGLSWLQDLLGSGDAGESAGQEPAHQSDPDAGPGQPQDTTRVPQPAGDENVGEENGSGGDAPGAQDRPEPSAGDDRKGGQTSVLGRCGGPPEMEAPSGQDALRGFAEAFSRKMDRWADGYAECVEREVENDTQKGMRGALDF
jgi:uncharacterized protein YkwD